MSIINISNLTFSYDGSYDNIFDEASFQLDTDWKLGFVGRNGRGKTTFLRLLMGEYEYTGSISSSVNFEYFPYHVADTDADTIQVVYEISYDFEHWELKRELSLLDVSEDVLYRPFNTLSFGEQTKVLLATLFLKENSFLLIDEPTNHLDMSARAKVSEYLNSKKGFILVSHDRDFLDNCVDHILSINRSNIEVQRGNFSSWQHNKELRDSFEQNENEKLKREVKKLSTAAKRTAGWSDSTERSKYHSYDPNSSTDRGYIGHKAAKIMKRSKAIETRQKAVLEEKSGLLKNLETADRLAIKPLNHHSERLVTIDNLSINYGQGDVCSSIIFDINKGDRIALKGKNGCGKSSILKLILGENVPYNGTLSIASGLVISYVSQDTSFLNGNLKDFASKSKIDESLFKAILRKLDFTRTQFEKDMSGFSGGQKKKVLIARSLCQQAHLYIWDEPLNFIDVLSRLQIEQLIKEHNPTMLFVEHDKAFSESVATKTILLV